jgi:lipopolysaccharide biosynthesis glycosyltransferase
VTIRSLGVDGGAAYSGEFSDLQEKTLLANGRTSFDKQFRGIAKTIMRTGIDYSPLNVESPIRIYVATTEAQMLAVKVLEYSIRKHTSMTVEVFPLHQSGIEIPLPREQKNYPRTPFSFQRFLIPALRGYQGRAIYLDSDMQVFMDFRQLWVLPLGGNGVLAVREPSDSGRRPQFSVMLLDCARLHWDIKKIVDDLDAGRMTYEQLMYQMVIAEPVEARIGPEWNSLERYQGGKTALLHYTDMNTQPWISTKNPLGYLWMRDLIEAVDHKIISLDYVREHVAKGYVRPSLLYQLEHRLDDSFLLPSFARSLDKDFKAPYLGIHGHNASPWTNPVQKLRAMFRHIYQKTPVYRLQRALKQRYSDR